MVKGQLRALGTPQHLKQTFGSGYEIILQLDRSGASQAAGASAIAEESHEARITSFVTGLFLSNGSSSPSSASSKAAAALLSDNGGLLTYRVDPEAIRGKVGEVFKALEENRETLGITDYVRMSEDGRSNK